MPVEAAIIAGATTAAVSTYKQGQYAEDVGKYQMQVAQAEAESAEVASEHETREKAIEGRKLRARQLVQFAKGGVVPSVGTPLKIQEQTGADVTRDIAMTKYGYDLYGQQALSRGRLEKSYGKQRKRSSRWMAGSTALTGAGMALDYRYNA